MNESISIRGGLTADASGEFATVGDEYVEREGGETVEAFQIRVRQLAQEAGSRLVVFGGLPAWPADRADDGAAP